MLLLGKMNSEIRRIISVKRIKHRKKDIVKICNNGGNNILFNRILVALFLIETTYRPWHYRVIEYVALFLLLWCNKILRKPIKNLTIGKCQIGLTTILNYYGCSKYMHLDYLDKLSIKEMLLILKAIKPDEYYKIFANKIRPLFYRAERIYGSKDERNISQYIGNQFNGQYIYGLLLAAVIYEMKDIEKINCLLLHT